MKIKTILAVLATLALLVACTVPPQGPVQVEVLNADEFGIGPAGATERGSLLCATEDGPCVESWNGSDIVVYSDAGSTEKFSVDGATGNVDMAGTLQYGANNLYPVGFATSGQKLVYGTTAITGTLSVPHGLTTVTFCQATLGEDPETGAGDAAFVTVAVAANACTVKAWQDAWNAAATETNVIVHWLVIGAP